MGLAYSEIRNAILEKIPPEVGITRIEFEGPRLSIYAKKPEILHQESHIIGELAGVIKKRIVIRSDPTVRMPELQSENIIKELLDDAGFIQAYFDPALGEVILEVEKPRVAIGKIDH
jgi:predicted metal-dependent RNase